MGAMTAGMNESKAQSNGSGPHLIQTLPISDTDSLYGQAFGTTPVSEAWHIRRAKWRSERAYEAAIAPGYVQPEDALLGELRDECDLNLTFKRSGNLISLFACVKYREVSVLVAGHDSKSAGACMDEQRAIFEPPADKVEAEPPSAEFGYWYLGEKGPERDEKKLNVPAWSEIKPNYAARTSVAIEGLLSGFKPGAGGRLLLWHGKPGTGKTFAIRSLAWEWREWCQFEYIFDPENLFGSRADYLAKIVLDGNEAARDGTTARWRVLVLEDTGELLSTDAKERAGQGLSRLLNAVDGLLGQGSRVLLLITTNEELGALHPAVTRPGRCASRVEFLSLSPAEATLWLSSHCEGRNGLAPKGPRTIAELYAILEGRTVPERLPIGFANG